MHLRCGVSFRVSREICGLVFGGSVRNQGRFVVGGGWNFWTTSRRTMSNNSIITILHNPQCSKSRAALQLLQSRSDLDLRTVLYKQEGPSVEQLQTIVTLLGVPAREICRSSAELADLKTASDEDVVAYLADNIIHMERPIILRGDPPTAAVIARPSVDKLVAFLDD